MTAPVTDAPTAIAPGGRRGATCPGCRRLGCVCPRRRHTATDPVSRGPVTRPAAAGTGPVAPDGVPLGRLARWTLPHRDQPCPSCTSDDAADAADATGFLAVVVVTAAGDCLLVVAQRCEAAGAWVPIRVVEATAAAVRMVRRQNGHGTTTTTTGGLW